VAEETELNRHKHKSRTLHIHITMHFTVSSSTSTNEPPPLILMFEDEDMEETEKGITRYLTFIDHLTAYQYTSTRLGRSRNKGWSNLII
jgi:hypothetical protein